jgi:aminoglycoside phosphotransferase (APT) family kinase protein
MNPAGDPGGLGEGCIVAQAEVWPDLGKVNAYCRTRIAGFEDFVSIKPIGDGFSNPTFLAITASGMRRVLRAMPLHPASAGAHRIDREYRVISALQHSRVPVPLPIHHCAEPAPVGSPFYIMSFVPGTVYANGKLPEAPGARRLVFLDLAACLGRLHGVDYRAMGLQDYGKKDAGAHFTRLVATMRQIYQDAQLGHEPAMERLFDVLSGISPAAEKTTLVHGDYRLGNVVIDPERSEIAAILDWELSTLGDPLMDVAYCTLMYHWASPTFGTVIGAGEGIPREAEFLETYCRHAGLPTLPDLVPYQALCLLRLACITQAALYREAHGTALMRPLPQGHQPGEVARLALDLLGQST